MTRVRPSLARAAAMLALAELLPPARPEPVTPPHSGAWQGGGRPLGRDPTDCDRRAFLKRVAKRRAKKGYA